VSRFSILFLLFSVFILLLSPELLLLIVFLLSLDFLLLLAIFLLLAFLLVAMILRLVNSLPSPIKILNVYDGMTVKYLVQDLVCHPHRYRHSVPSVRQRHSVISQSRNIPSLLTNGNE